MLQHWRLLLLLLCVLTVSGCTRTKMGGTVSSPDGNLELSVACLGAYGRAYVDASAKECGVSLRTKGSADPLFRKRVDLEGGTVAWNVRWDSAESIEIEFFECVSGCFSPEFKRGRDLRRLHLVIDQASGNVSEVAT